MTPQLVLSLFPGIGLLDMAFEAEGFCVVRGPDLLWGGDIRRFHPPAGKFDGVIGGPPCQAHSRLVGIVRARWGEHAVAEDLIPEFERVIGEAAPAWFLMENVAGAPVPLICGYGIVDRLLNNRWVGEAQNRLRRFSWGVRGGSAQPPCAFVVEESALESAVFESAVCSTSGGRRTPVAIGGSGKPKGPNGKSYSPLKNRSLAKECELQGLPTDFFDETPFTLSGKRLALGNGVPLPMGRAVARAVKRALGIEAVA